MFKFDIKEIEREVAMQTIQRYHYFNTLLKLNKHLLGFFLANEWLVWLHWDEEPIRGKMYDGLYQDCLQAFGG